MLDDTALTRIMRFVSGELPPEEIPDTERWIAADPARANAVQALTRLWNHGAAERESAAAGGPAEWDLEGAWRRLADGKPGLVVAGAPDQRHTPVLRLMRSDVLSRPWQRRIRPMVAAAAAAFLLAGGSFWAWQAASAPSRSAVPTEASPAPFREFTTARAQRAEIRLGDGSVAVLAPASRLRVPTGYGVSTRELELEGEAFFDVRHDSTLPFRVRTARGVTEDIGTRFDISAYPGDSIEQVAVVEGAVLLRPAGDTTGGAMLTERQLAVLSSAGAPAVRTVADVDRYVAWTEGRLVFRNTPLREVAVQLGRWYALDVRVTDPALGRLLFTGSFRNESVAEVLHSLELALDLRARLQGDRATLSAAVAPPQR